MSNINLFQNKLIESFDFSIRDRGYPGFDYFFEKNNDNGVWDGKNMDTINPLTAIIIMKTFDLQKYIKFLLESFSVLQADEKIQWYENFTRTIFLFGDPLKVANKYSKYIDYTNEDYAFCKPRDPYHYTGIKLMLRAVNTTTSGKHKDAKLIQNIANTNKVEISLDLENLKLERYLVHLSHTVFEGLIKDRFTPQSNIQIKHHKDLTIDTSIYSRVDIDELNPTKLKVYSVIQTA